MTVTTDVTEVSQGLGGVPATGDHRAEEPQPKPAPQPRYAEVGDLPDRVVSARKATGRTVLAQLLNISPSACWRAENARIRPEELDNLRERLPGIEDRIARGEFAKAKASKDDRIDRAVELLRKAQSDKGVTRAQLIEELLGILAPADAPKA